MHIGGARRLSEDARLAILADQPESTPDVLDDAPANFQSPAWSPDGSRLLYAAEDADGKQALYIRQRQSGRVGKLANVSGLVRFNWSPDGQWVAFQQIEDPRIAPLGHIFVSRVGVTDAESELRQVSRDAAVAFFWSPDSRCFFVNGRPGRHPINAFIHEVAARKTVELATAGEHTGAFSPDGNTVVLCGPTLGTGPLDCRIHDTRTGKLQRTLSLHNGKAMCVAFSPDGRFMASGGHDRKLKIWRFAPAAQPQKGNPPAAARR